MGADIIMLAIIAVGFAAFIIGVGYADIVADEKAITYDQEQVARLQAVPVKAKVAEFKKAA